LLCSKTMKIGQVIRKFYVLGRGCMQCQNETSRRIAHFCLTLTLVALYPGTTSGMHHALAQSTKVAPKFEGMKGYLNEQVVQLGLGDVLVHIPDVQGGVVGRCGVYSGLGRLFSNSRCCLRCCGCCHNFWLVFLAGSPEKIPAFWLELVCSLPRFLVRFFYAGSGFSVKFESV